MKTTDRVAGRRSRCPKIAMAIWLVVLPVAIVRGQDYEALQRRLAEGVQAGELTEPQARFMLNALRLAEELHKPVESADGKREGSRSILEKEAGALRDFMDREAIPAEQGRTWLNEMRRRIGPGRRDRGRQEGAEAVDAEGRQRRLLGALRDLDIDRERLQQVAGTLERIVAEIRAEGDQFELDPEMARYLAEELGMSDDKVERLMAVAQRLAAGADDNLERDGDPFHRRLMGALVEAGIKREQVPDVFSAMEAIAAEIRSEGESFELAPDTRRYLESLDLSERQIDTVIRLARRLADQASPLPPRDGDDAGGKFNAGSPRG